MPSKQRPRWEQLPCAARELIERGAGAPVLRATSCPGGFSPGFASRLELADGRRVFAKAMDAAAWPFDAELHRAEIRATAALPPGTPAPRLLGHADEAGWVVLVLQDVPGAEPGPWQRGHYERAVAGLPQVDAPVGLPQGRPRLGGWAGLDPARLAAVVPWAAARLPGLVELEAEGLRAARGTALVHFDCYPHNVLLTPARVWLVDWPHARAGDPLLDVLTLGIDAAANGIDPEPLLAQRFRVVGRSPRPAAVDALLAAHTGFLLRGALTPVPPGLEPIGEAKLRLGLAASDWLERRLRPGRS